jgi:hypothetical protein
MPFKEALEGVMHPNTIFFSFTVLGKFSFIHMKYTTNFTPPIKHHYEKHEFVLQKFMNPNYAQSFLCMFL